MRIGIDVGGTNTDSALMDGGVKRGARKSPTTADVSAGIIAVLRRVLAIADTSPATITAVMIGPTHLTNAVVERRRLLEVAGVRLSCRRPARFRP